MISRAPRFFEFPPYDLEHHLAEPPRVWQLSTAQVDAATRQISAQPQAAEPLARGLLR